MSRRYGRKQRRAAQEMILDLACTNRMLRGRVNNQMAERNAARAEVEFLRDRIRLWDTEIRSLLGPYTSFSIEEPTYRVDHPDQIRQMPVLAPLSVRPFGPSEIVEQSIAYHIQTMLGFMYRLDEEYLTRLRRLITLRVVVGREPRGETGYYAVSEDMWYQMKRDGPNSPGLERFIHRIAGDLVRLLVAPPKEKLSGDDLVYEMERVRRDPFASRG